jgi:predicted transposase YdaD
VSKPYDATTKDLLEIAPADWLAFLGHPAPGRVRLIDADLSTVTAEADKILLVEEDPPWLLHLELQSGRDESLVRRMLRYNVLLAERHGLPVSSAVILLRSGIDFPGLNGLYRDRSRLDGREHRFPYRVIRLWRQPVEAVLAGGVATLPLAPLARTRQRDLPGVVQRMQDRLASEAPRPLAAKLWAATYVLLGLRYPRALADRLLRGVLAMEESVTYQAILERGGIAEARRLLLLNGSKKLGAPDAATREAIAALADLGRLEELHQRLFDVSSWRELLAPKR